MIPVVFYVLMCIAYALGSIGAFGLALYYFSIIGAGH